MLAKHVAYAWFAMALAAIVLLALLVPPTPLILRELHISAVAYRFVVFTLLLPYGIIWFSALYGYEQMRRYARMLPGTTEGRAYKKIADGLGVFAWGLILGTLLSEILMWIASTASQFVGTETIINHYFTLAVTLVSFTLIGDGTYALAQSVRAKHSKGSIRLLILVGTIIGVLFTRLVIHNNFMHDSPYYLSLTPLLLTLIIPYVYTWIIGLHATAELFIYAQKVRGILYRQALQKLSNGISIVLILSIAGQYITAGFSTRSGTAVPWVLTIAYSFLVVEAAGFGLVAWGAKQLKRIEEI